MANTVLLWKGAVEPIGRLASGNQYKAWKGAVEPSQGFFDGLTASDGGSMWMPRSGDPRWMQFITDSGITATGNFMDDVHSALEAAAVTTGQNDDLWKKVKALYSITDTSEPFTY